MSAFSDIPPAFSARSMLGTEKIVDDNLKYHIQPNYRTCSYKHTVKQFSGL